MLQPTVYVPQAVIEVILNFSFYDSVILTVPAQPLGAMKHQMYVMNFAVRSGFQAVVEECTLTAFPRFYPPISNVKSYVTILNMYVSIPHP